MSPREITYIISNHAELDHSGALPRAIDLIQPEKVFASTMGVVALRAHFAQLAEIVEVNHNEPFQLGDAQLKCIESRMLHWPDSMFTYFANDGILFSQDGFAMHFAPPSLFADECDNQILYGEAKKYFANILLPYTNFVTRFLAALPGFDLDIKILAPDHGPLWRRQQDITWIINLWQQWATRQITSKAVICYATMWGSTARMAAAIADGLSEKAVEVKVMPLANSHRSEIALELMDAGALIIGSPTLNNQMFPTVADLLCYLRGLKIKNLLAQTFGSFGWSGEAVNSIKEELLHMFFRIAEPSCKVRYVPDETELMQCRELGIRLAGLLQKEGTGQ